MQMPPFHGRKGDTLLLIGPVDAPVTHSQVAEAVEACRKLHVARADVLGFEFEMGLVPHAQDEAKAKGVSLALRYIPREVFDKRAVEKGQERWPGESGQEDKWIFCLSAARIAADQERA